MVRWIQIFQFIIALWSSSATAVDLEAYYGRQFVENNELFDSSDGYGVENGGRLLFYPGIQEFFAIGAYYTKTHYKLSSDRDVEGIEVTGTGQFDTDYFGPTIQATAPVPFLTLYGGFSYISGSCRYVLNKSSFFDSAAGDRIQSDTVSSVSLASRGISGFGGLKTTGRVSFFLEFGESFQTITVKSVAVATGNLINGARETRDAEESSYSSTFQDIVGESMNFTTHSVVAGIEASL